MRISKTFLVTAPLVLLGCAEPPVEPSESHPYGQLSGVVTGSEPGVLPVVHAYNSERNVGYTVFVVNGKYRTVNIMPGRYAVTVRPAVGQLEKFTPETVQLEIVAGAQVKADFVLKNVSIVPDYVGGIAYPVDEAEYAAGGIEYAAATIAPYDEIYPPGPGRDVLERTCHGCHHVQFFPYNVPRVYTGGRAPKDKVAWGATVDRMHNGPAFNRKGKASMFDPALLPPQDRDVLVDYLTENFGVDSEPRVVQLVTEPELDLEALEKAMFVEYIFPNTASLPVRYSQQVDFDNDGNVWIADRGQPGAIVWLDPRTGESKAYEGHGGGHGIAVDQTDGTVWFSGDVVRHLDPTTGLVDHWKLGDDSYLGSNTQIFDSKGNLWLSLIVAGGLGKWDRKTNSVVWWEVPVLRTRPYGIIVDHNDAVWISDYHNGGVTRFDPETETFKHFELVKDSDTAANSIRRLGVDSKGMIWASTWGSRGMQNGTLHRLNPATGEVMERKVGIEYTNPYNAEADEHDNIWVTTDNYLVRYAQQADTFTRYPVPRRTDIPKATIARNGGIWFEYRNGAKYGGYGGSAAVLYPDKDNITTLAAYHSENSAGYHLSKYQGPLSPPVIGGDRVAPVVAQNADSYAEFAMANGLLDAQDAAAEDDGGRVEEELAPGAEVERAD
jgi:streptogramin lyase